MPPNHHHRGGVQLAVLLEQGAAVGRVPPCGVGAEEEVLVDADGAAAVGDEVVIIRAFTKGETGQGLVGVEGTTVVADLQILCEPPVAVHRGGVPPDRGEDDLD